MIDHKRICGVEGKIGGGGIDDGRKSEDGDILDGIVVTVMIGG